MASFFQRYQHLFATDLSASAPQDVTHYSDLSPIDKTIERCELHAAPAEPPPQRCGDAAKTAELLELANSCGRAKLESTAILI